MVVWESYWPECHTAAFNKDWHGRGRKGLRGAEFFHPTLPPTSHAQANKDDGRTHALAPSELSYDVIGRRPDRHAHARQRARRVGRQARDVDEGLQMVDGCDPLPSCLDSLCERSL